MKKWGIMAFFVVGLVILGGLVMLSDDSLPPKTGDNNEGDFTKIAVNDIEVQVEVVSTPGERAQGLSGRMFLAENQGMFFVFEESTKPSFWMKDMFFAIDIVWVDEALKVIGVEANISPETFPQTFSPPGPILYVLEVNAGWADEHLIQAGDRLRLSN